MKQIERNKFRKVLEARVIELDRSIGRRDMITIEETADALDRRLQATEREFAVRSLEADSARLRETCDALQRIDDDTYGFCLECERAINAVRLAAVPWAALCIQCREVFDCRCGAKCDRPVLALAA
jgi:DnaK suppressor protein